MDTNQSSFTITIA